MKKAISVTILLFLISVTAFPATDTFSLSGRITDNEDNPVPSAGLVLKETGVWTVADENGFFEFENIRKGTYTLEISCLGYVTKTVTLDTSIRADLKIIMQENSLAIDEVVVTARQSDEAMNTSLVFGRNALDHLQMSNVADIAALFPGGKRSILT